VIRSATSLLTAQDLAPPLSLGSDLFHRHGLHLLNFTDFMASRLSAFAPGSLHSEQHGLAQLFLEFSRSS
jgi:hypothetical protein